MRVTFSLFTILPSMLEWEMKTAKYIGKDRAEDLRSLLYNYMIISLISVSDTLDKCLVSTQILWVKLSKWKLCRSLLNGLCQFFGARLNPLLSLTPSLASGCPYWICPFCCKYSDHVFSLMIINTPLNKSRAPTYKWCH